MTTAHTARPVRKIEWQRKISATRSVTESRTVYADITQIDAMITAGLLRDCEARAALRLYGLFLAAGLTPRTTQRQDVAHEDAGDVELAGDNMPPAEDALMLYRSLLRGLDGDRGCVVDSLMHSTLPAWRMGVAITGLGLLADYWGFEG